MKKTLLLMACALVLAACGEQNPQSSQEQQPGVQSVLVEPSQASLTVGQTKALQVTVLPADAADQTPAWSSSHSQVASVSTGGVVTALSPGIATIKATAGGISGSCVVTVSQAWVEVSGLSLEPGTLSLRPGDQASLKATVSPSDASDPSVSWDSDAPAVAMVDDKGGVVALSPGQARITAQAGNYTAACQVTVQTLEVAVSSVTLSEQALTLEKGKMVRLVATVLPENATDRSVRWSSSAPQFASVDADGWVTGLSAGTAVISARAGDQTATCTVTVTGDPSGNMEGIGYDED